MEMELHHLLAGIGMGGLHPDGEAFIEKFPFGGDEFSIIEVVGLEIGLEG
jgi:hypothetical protein